MNELYGLLIAAMLGGAIAIRLLEEMVRMLLKRGTVQTVWIDPETRNAAIKREKTNRQGEIVKKVGDEKAAFIPQGGAAYNTPDGPLYLMDPNPRRGYNFTAPTDMEIVAGRGGMVKLQAFNPISYHKAMRVNKYQMALNARAGEENVWVKLAPFMLIGLLLVIVVMGFVAWKVTQIGSGMAAATGGA